MTVRVSETSYQPLFEPYRLGAAGSPRRMALPNRIMMAPMTRFRADEHGTPRPVVADYYSQRATAGLIVTEGIWPSHAGQAGWWMPGLATPDHVAGWQVVTAAVHAAGGRIFAQLMHSGRAAHPLSRIDGSHPRAPSAVAPVEPLHTKDGKTAPTSPLAMTIPDIEQAIADHVSAARRAMAAGFDGVELHGANGYLIHQFLADNTNLRTDGWGGSRANKMRFAVEVTTAVAEAVGAERTAVRLSPANPQAGIIEADPAPLYQPLVHQLDRLGLAYLHLIDNDCYPAVEDLKPWWTGTLAVNIGENREPTEAAAAACLIGEGRADLVSFGRLYISNPDLPERLAAGAPLQRIRPEDLYTHGARGYTDYPTMGAPVGVPRQ